MKEPAFTSLAYADSGLYVCEASLAGLVRQQSFDLVVEGQHLLIPLVASNRLRWILTLCQKSF